MNQMGNPSVAWKPWGSWEDFLSPSNALDRPLPVCHEFELRAQSTAGGLEATWQKAYGNTFRIGGCFAQDILMTADPKAIQHILRNSGYRYPKTKDIVHVWELAVGRSVVAAGGSAHQRQRRILGPAFSPGQLKKYATVFKATGIELCGKIRELVSQGPTEINMLKLTGRAALDNIGLASLGCKFGALDGSSSEMADLIRRSFTTLSSIPPTPLIVLAPALWRFLPKSMLFILDRIPTPEIKIFRKFKTISRRTARETIKTAHRDGSRDLATLLAEASDKNLLDEDEVLSQLATFTLAAEDTVASAISWTLYELSRCPEYQARVREEIIRLDDYETMPLLNAAINETLRLHPLMFTFSRYAAENDVIPLSDPITTRTGMTLNEIPVEKGQMLMISAYTYNRLSSVWGKDPDHWNPERFLQERSTVSVGLHENLLNFSDGVHGCIGWKYGVIQLQVILVELLKSFEFLNSEVEILNGSAFVGLIPVVKGREQEGMQVPVIVKASKY
ncbi:cytochrome P450 [Desarmillaria tabescens]|uniref:Cytochrome P450 n=1 Tax=Armillaria tabescens TaxID=1929756 RepID=A0AA39JYE9_ARMTA|nr:cytochrome P450 [Desarmillaria tabescens]KAK0451237.1 cytochrome P450 [Desarmillaria tabescens]